MSRTWAYLSNYLVYSSMAVYTLSFFAHAIETAWAVRVTTEDSKKNIDYKRTEKVARIATAMMILGFLLLIALYGAGILSYSVFQKKTIRSSQFSYLIIYIAVIGLFANFPGFLNYGIITKDKSYMRDFPSSAAPVERLLKKGNRINYWFTRDIWVYSLIENQQGYVKEDDFLPIN